MFSLCVLCPQVGNTGCDIPKLICPKDPIFAELQLLAFRTTEIHRVQVGKCWDGGTKAPKILVKGQMGEMLFKGYKVSVMQNEYTLEV